MKFLFILTLLLAGSALGAGFSESLAFRGQAGGETLLNGLQAAWSFDEIQNSGSRVAQFGNFTLTDPNAKVGSMRANMGGSATFTNGSGYTLNMVAHQPTFSGGPGVSFSVAFWIIGANANNSYIEVGDTASPNSFDWRFDGTPQWIAFDSGGTPHQINLGIDTSVFKLYVVGFDSATHQMFASYDGAAKSFVSTGGLDLRDTGTYKLQLAYINGACDEFYFWNRMLTDGEIARLKGATFALGLKYPFGTETTAAYQTSSYLWAVTNAGGYATPSSSNGVWNLVNTLLNAGVYNKFNMIVGFCPDTLQAAMVPIKSAWFQTPGNDIHSPAFDPYSRNNSYSSGNLSVNGLAGVLAAPATTYALTPALNQSLAAQTQWPTVNDSGFSIATPSTTFEAQSYQFGFYDNGLSPIPGAFFRINSFEGTTRAILGDENGVLVEPGAPTAGFYSVNRDSSTSAKMFFFSAGTPNGTTVSTNASNSNPTFRGIVPQVGGMDLTSSGPYYGSAIPLSFLATHTHLTLAEASNTYSGVAVMRGIFGGGLPNDVNPQPTNSAVLFGNNRTFVANATSATAYQWSKNGVPIAGATQSTYTITGASLSDFGTYQMTFTEPGGPVNSQPAQLATVTTTTVSNWTQQVSVGGGGAMSSNTVWAVDQFWNGMVTDGVSAKMFAVNCYVPDSLSAAITPLLNTGGPNLWVNHAFVGGDLTVNGLAGDGTTKYLDMGITDTGTFSSVNDVGFTVYEYATVGNGGLMGIIAPDFSTGYMINPDRSGNSQWYDYGPATGGLGNLHATYANDGYYCGVRTASNAEAFYFANSTHAHAALATGATASSTALTGQNIFIYNTSGLTLITTITLSYTSISKGLTSTDSSNQYNRVQTLRTVLGGGFR